METYFSVDIETSGPIVGVHSMLSIGACNVNNSTETFAAILKPVSDAFVPEAIEIVGNSIEYFQNNGRDIDEVMAELSSWIRLVARDSTPVFVAFNATFDWAFVNWYFIRNGGINPFGIGGLDIKSYYAGSFGVGWSQTKSSLIPSEYKLGAVHSHDALSDSLEQSAMFSLIRARAEKENLTNLQVLRKNLRNREHAANLQATQHAYLRDFYARWNTALTIFALLLTAFLLPLSLVTDTFALDALHLSPELFKLVNASIAMSAFAIVLVQLVWKPDSKQQAHRAAVNHFTIAKFGFRSLLQARHMSESDIELAQQKYLDVRDLPEIPERWFLPLKKWHEEKLNLSKALTNDPKTTVPKPWWWLR